LPAGGIRPCTIGDRDDTENKLFALRNMRAVSAIGDDEMMTRAAMLEPAPERT
jgi:hypothetical protein